MTLGSVHMHSESSMLAGLITSDMDHVDCRTWDGVHTMGTTQGFDGIDVSLPPSSTMFTGYDDNDLTLPYAALHEHGNEVNGSIDSMSPSLNFAWSSRPWDLNDMKVGCVRPNISHQMSHERYSSPSATDPSSIGSGWTTSNADLGHLSHQLTADNPHFAKQNLPASDWSYPTSVHGTGQVQAPHPGLPPTNMDTLQIESSAASTTYGYNVSPGYASLNEVIPSYHIEYLAPQSLRHGQAIGQQGSRSYPISPELGPGEGSRPALSTSSKDADGELDVVTEDEEEVDDEDDEEEEPTEEDCNNDSDYRPSGRHTRKRSRTSLPSLAPRTARRLNQRAPSQRQDIITKRRGKTKNRTHPATPRAFPCPFAVYGCSASFAAKNEWKRHINTQHMRMYVWRCNLCLPSPRVRRQTPIDPSRYDFNRKDLFTMHLKRTHPAHCAIDAVTAARNAANSGKRSGMKDSEETIRLCNALALRCQIALREPPEMTHCIICGTGDDDIPFKNDDDNGAAAAPAFTGPDCWNARIEHLATEHFERVKKGEIPAVSPLNWRRDQPLEEYLVANGIIREVDGKLRFTE